MPAAARDLEFLIFNPDARKQIGEAAGEKIEADLPWDALAKKYLEMFEEAILLRAARLRRDESAYLRWRGYGVTCGNW